MDYGLKNKIQFLLFIGENEIKENKIKIKCLANFKELIVEEKKWLNKEDKNLLIIKKKE